MDFVLQKPLLFPYSIKKKKIVTSSWTEVVSIEK
jgi:hypothetical protein